MIAQGSLETAGWIRAAAREGKSAGHWFALLGNSAGRSFKILQDGGGRLR